MKGKGPFIISKESPREALSKLSWKSTLYIWVGPVLTLARLWEILLNGETLLRSLVQN